MPKKEKDEKMKITFHNPNSAGEIRKFLIKILVDDILENTIHNSVNENGCTTS